MERSEGVVGELDAGEDNGLWAWGGVERTEAGMNVGIGSAAGWQEEEILNDRRNGGRRRGGSKEGADEGSHCSCFCLCLFGGRE